MNAVGCLIEPQARPAFIVRRAFVHQWSPVTRCGDGFDPERHGKIGVVHSERVERRGGRRNHIFAVGREVGAEIIGRGSSQRGAAGVRAVVSGAGRVGRRGAARFVELPVTNQSVKLRNFGRGQVFANRFERRGARRSSIRWCPCGCQRRELRRSAEPDRPG